MEIKRHVIESEERIDESGKVMGLLSASLDITERKRVEEALRKSEKDLKEAQRLGRIGSWDWDATTDTITWSEEYYCIYGFDPKQPPSGYEEHKKAYTPQSAARLDAAVKRNMETGESYELDLELARTEGLSRWITARSETKRDAQGHIIGLRGTAQDITQRKRAEEELHKLNEELEHRVDERTGKLVESQKSLMNMVEELNQAMEALHESKERYRMLVEFSPDGIMVHDTEKFTFANKAASDILGASSPEELIGKTILDIIHPDYKETVIQRLQIEKGGKKVPLIEQKFLRMDGTPIDVEVVAFPIKYEDRIEVHSVVRDITERKKLIDAIKAANVRLIEIDRLKSAFLATMSHELRTPLNSIIGYTGLILMGYSGSINDEQKKQLDMVNTSANHLLSLIVDILDISKIESGQLRIYNAPFMMKTAIDNAVQIVVPLAQTKGLELHVEVSPHVRVIRSDQKRIEQILINLLGNAIKFTEIGEVKLECHVRDDQLITRIIDTGIGIKPENMDRLFKPFLQLDNGLTRRYEGTGLGLSICKKLVEMLGGWIWAESEIGKGSVFTFTLPVKGKQHETKNTHCGQCCAKWPGRI